MMIGQKLKWCIAVQLIGLVSKFVYFLPQSFAKRPMHNETLWRAAKESAKRLMATSFHPDGRNLLSQMAELNSSFLRKGEAFLQNELLFSFAARAVK